MARSGCSGLLDSMSLELKGEEGPESVNSDEASMETVSFHDQESLPMPSAPCSMPKKQLGHERQPTGGASHTWQAEPSDMSCDADRYVQVITSGEEPFQIVWASEAWLQLCEYSMGQVLGHTLELIQGPLTTRTSLGQLMGGIRAGNPVSLSMVNHTRTGKAFSHTLRVEPLRDSRGRVQCFQATSSNIEFIDPKLHMSIPIAGAASNFSLDSGSHGPSLVDTDDSPFDLPPASPLDSKQMPRVSSDLKISEMLDLFDTSRGAAPVAADSVDWQ